MKYGNKMDIEPRIYVMLLRYMLDIPCVLI